VQPLLWKTISITQPERVFVALGIQNAMRYVPYCHLLSALIYNIFPHYRINCTIFGQKLLNAKYILNFSINFVRDIFNSKKNWARYDKTYFAYSCPILMKLEVSGQIFEKYSNIKFHENPSSVSGVVRCGQTDMKLMVFIAVLRSHLKTKALIVIKSGKTSRATYHVNCEHKFNVSYS
jgi:hypothetical protein